MLPSWMKKLVIPNLAERIIGTLFRIFPNILGTSRILLKWLIFARAVLEIYLIS